MLPCLLASVLNGKCLTFYFMEEYVHHFFKCMNSAQQMLIATAEEK
jgi:hypothetical protein